MVYKSKSNKVCNNNNKTTTPCSTSQTLIPAPGQELSLYMSTNFINDFMHPLTDNPRHLEFVRITHMESPLCKTMVPRPLSLLSL